ncbi:MAG: lipopolysaccharide heptosyltransferase [Solimicrobium sp.]|jgi:heptosyltransferase-3|nr:lipopolysaccharide heptosyltransferase [Solimicrobium sp.]
MTLSINSEKSVFKSVGSILLISTRQIGDLLLTTPLIHTLRQNYPTAKIDILLFEGRQGVLEGNSDVNELIQVNEKPSFKQYILLVRHIFKKYDLAIATQTGDRPHLFALLAAKKRIGLIPDKKSHQWWKKLLCRIWQIIDDSETHTVTQNLLLAKSMGLTLHYNVILPESTHSKSHITSTFDSDISNLPYVVIHPYPLLHYKRWNITGWRSLINHLHSIGLHVVISGGNNETELAYCKEIAQPFSTMITNLAGQASFAEASFLLQRATAYIGMDTAMTHLAAASGTSTIAIFGPTNPVKWAPWPFGYKQEKSPWRRYSSHYQLVNNVMLLQGQGDCVPCHKAGCDNHTKSHSLCLDELPVTRVIEALTVLLKSPQKISGYRKLIPILHSSSGN